MPQDAPRDAPNEELHEPIEAIAEEVKQEVTAARRPWYHLSRIARILLSVYAVQLALFAALAWWVHVNPILPLDVTITREFQENPTPWLHITMLVVSYPGSSLLLPLLVLAAAVVFWSLDLRLEAIFIVALSAVSTGLNGLLKLLVERPRPSANLVEVFQAAAGQSFPSGHVMAYLAFWGLLFSFGVILFTGKSWWRILLLVLSAVFVALVGPSRVYLGDHWASDVLGSYLIGGALLGITLWVYLRLKERGILETKSTHARTASSKVIRSFPRR